MKFSFWLDFLSLQQNNCYHDKIKRLSKPNKHNIFLSFLFTLSFSAVSTKITFLSHIRSIIQLFCTENRESNPNFVISYSSLLLCLTVKAWVPVPSVRLTLKHVTLILTHDFDSYIYFDICRHIDFDKC